MPRKSVTMYPFTKIIGVEHIEFGNNIIIDDFVLIIAKEPMKIGSYVHIGSFSSIVGGSEFEMGDFSGLSHGCRIITGTEDFKNGGFGNPTIDEEYRGVTRSPIKIGRFSVIGANSVILPGVTIGEGVSVGAGSVVSKNLDSWGVYIGNRRIGERNKKKLMSNYKRFLSDKFILDDQA